MPPPGAKKLTGLHFLIVVVLSLADLRYPKITSQKWQAGWVKAIADESSFNSIDTRAGFELIFD